MFLHLINLVGQLPTVISIGQQRGTDLTFDVVCNSTPKAKQHELTRITREF